MEKKFKTFKKGDYVILKDAAGIFTIEKNRTYKVIDVDFNFNGDQTIALEGDIDIDPTYDYDGNLIHKHYNSRRFTNDPKPLRNLKLQKIKKKYEI